MCTHPIKAFRNSRIIAPEDMPAADSPDLGQKRIRVLDGLRAMAIMLVLGRHSIKIFWVDISADFPPFVPFLMNGWCGVDLFFVLSGFLIARQLLGGDTILHFYKKRFLRIAPVYYLILTLACLGVFPGFPLQDPAHVWGWRYIYHLLFLQDVFPPDIYPVFWSLAIECQFYVLAPFLVAGLLLASRRKRYLLFALALTFSVSLKVWAFLHWFPQGTDYDTYCQTMRICFPFQLDGFIVGMLAAFLWRDDDTRRYLSRRVVANTLFWSGTALFIALSSFSIHLDVYVSLFAASILTPLLSTAFGAMMLGLLGGCSGHRMFTTSSLRFIALISYSLYLIHTAVRLPCVEAVFTVIPKSNPMLAWLVFLIPYLFLSVLLSTVSYFAIERPCIAWSKKPRS